MTCAATGKKLYASLKLATRAAVSLGRRAPEGVKANPYLCQHCGEWHIGRLGVQYSEKRWAGTRKRAVDEIGHKPVTIAQALEMMGKYL